MAKGEPGDQVPRVQQIWQKDPQGEVMGWGVGPSVSTASAPRPSPDSVPRVDSAARSLTKRAVSVTGAGGRKLDLTAAGQQISIKQLLPDPSLLLWSIHTGLFPAALPRQTDSLLPLLPRHPCCGLRARSHSHLATPLPAQARLRREGTLSRDDRRHASAGPISAVETEKATDPLMHVQVKK